MRRVPKSVRVFAGLTVLSVAVAAALYIAPYPRFDDETDDEECLCGPAEAECELDDNQRKAYRPTFVDGRLRRPSKDLFKE